LNFRKREFRATVCSYSFKNTDHPCDVCYENECIKRDPNENPNEEQASQGTDSSSGQTGTQAIAGSGNDGKTVIILHCLGIISS
jgi:hypothetical protein